MDSIFQRRILAALNVAQFPTLIGPGRLSTGHIFSGIDPAEKAKRRAKGKAQRAARRKHR
ncbi:hypothetical protein PQE18_gp54 [Arthrobacter phage DrSierra]|uniref:Uncharacterized protein n=1 Tax=Arthrobacter phage DrSierra TaxID=2704034 RepID=A0A6G6XKA7_9CAUD|nr:hypothetical protein PQE18_gp54 [Arthrobacter phage DrSierra]QIG58532.1 hypothetical protein SEA_DRSIERRA_54 [Arthrobacter phage DrSierra]